MSEWKECKLGDICKITRGASPRPIHDYISIDGIPWVKISDATSSNSRYISQTKEFIKIEGAKHSVIVGPDDLILSNSATPGLPKFMKIRACIHDGWLLLRDFKSIDKNFLYYLLIADREKYVQFGNGSIFTNLKTDILKEHIFPLPPLPEQKAIAGVLSSLDDKIDLLQRQNKTLEGMAEALWRKMFIEDADESWAKGTLGDIALNIRENVNVHNLKVHSHYVGLEHIERKHLALYKWGSTDSIVSNKSLFSKRDILFGKLRAYFHKVCFAPVEGICSTDILVIRSKDPDYFPFCLLWFYNEDVVNFSDASSGGTRMPRTNWETLSSYEILIPPHDIIIQFNKKIITLIDKIELNIFSIASLEKMRDTLLSKLMSGEVRVKT